MTRVADERAGGGGFAYTVDSQGLVLHMRETPTPAPPPALASVLTSSAAGLP